MEEGEEKGHWLLWFLYCIVFYCIVLYCFDAADNVVRIALFSLPYLLKSIVVCMTWMSECFFFFSILRSLTMQLRFLSFLSRFVHYSLHDKLFILFPRVEIVVI